MRTRLLSSGLLLVCLAAATPVAAAEPLHEPFRVMTYNVRQVNADDTGDYTWQNRSAGVMQVIADNDPDIFGVQESSSAVIQDDLVAAFDAEYDRFQPTNGSPKTIFFRRDRFARLADPPGDGEGIITIANPYPEDHACFPNAKGRTAAWLLLRDLVSGRGYLLVNAHVAHGGDCWLARNAAAKSLHELIAARSAGLGIVLFGDLNSDPQRDGADPDDDIVPLLEAPQAGYTLARSARHTGVTTSETATFNSAWKAPSSSYTRLDYIFTAIADATTHHQTVDRREVDGISPSDHFAVLATIRSAPFAPEPLVDEQPVEPVGGLLFADVTGDGAADKIVWSPFGPVRVHPADGAGGFGEAIAGETVDPNMWFADIDGDGCADRLAHDLNAGFSFARAACDGSFAAAVTTGGPLGGVPKLLFARIDADACADLLWWQPSVDGGRTRVALSQCDGSFAAEIVNDEGGDLDNLEGTIGLADVTGDGLADKLVWDPKQFDGRTRVFAGVGDGTFTFLGEHTGGTSGVAASRFLFADVDADGHADKLFWRFNFREGHPQLYRGQADGFDPHPTMVNAGPSESADNRYYLADIDGSGAHDLIAWDPVNASGTRAYLALVHTPPPEPPGDESSGGEESTTDATTSTGEPPDATTSTGELPTTGADPSPTTDVTSSGSASGDSEGPAVDDSDAGCGCTHATCDDRAALLALLALAIRRRRTRRPAAKVDEGR